jgi:ferric-dicitrate binding protein FerR (iron transport regulator)
MHDDRHEGVHDSDKTTGASERDELAALINAAGKRATPPDEAWQQVFTAAHAAWQAKLRTRQIRSRRLALAASVAIVALGAAFLVQRLPREAAPVMADVSIVQGEVLIRDAVEQDWRPLDSIDSTVTVGAEIRTLDNGRIALTLGGNGSLRVDSGSQITIAGPTQFDLFAGTLYVDSGNASAGGPFVIATPLGSVRDIGTQFEVATLPETLRVRIRDGAVSIAGSSSTAVLYGSAGEQLRLGAGGEVARDALTPYDPAWSWVEMLAGVPDIEGESLLSFLDWVARETGRALRFDVPLTESRARSVILHGDAADLLPMEALDVVLSTTDFAYALDGDGAIVVSMRSR